MAILLLVDSWMEYLCLLLRFNWKQNCDAPWGINHRGRHMSGMLLLVECLGGASGCGCRIVPFVAATSGEVGMRG